MNTREISNLAYQEIKEKGLLSKARFEVYDVIDSFGECCARQVEYALNQRGRSTVSSRFSELVRLGVIHKVAERVFEGQVHGFYSPTGLTPTKKADKAPKRMIWALEDPSGKLTSFFRKYPDQIQSGFKLVAFKEI